MKRAFLNVSGVGICEINADGIYTFTPSSNYNGPIPTASYTVSDGNEVPDVLNANLTIIFKPVKVMPDAKYDNSISLEDTPVTIDKLVNGSYTEIDVLMQNNAVIDPSGNLIYTPNANFNGLHKLFR